MKIGRDYNILVDTILFEFSPHGMEDNYVVFYASRKIFQCKKSFRKPPAVAPYGYRTSSAMQ